MSHYFLQHNCMGDNDSHRQMCVLLKVTLLCDVSGINYSGKISDHYSLSIHYIYKVNSYNVHTKGFKISHLSMNEYMHRKWNY